jgi:hypothetical protein
MTIPALLSNNAGTVLALALASSGTSATLYPGAGALFPSPGAGQYFPLTLISASNSATTEIVYCTARSGDVVTITRAQEGTTALSWNAGDLVNNQITAGIVEDIESRFALLAGSATQVFNVANATTASEAVALAQMTVAIAVETARAEAAEALRALLPAPSRTVLTTPGAPSPTVPVGCTAAFVRLVGGGGGSAGGTSTQATGGGGGGGYAEALITGLTAGALITCIVGAGGIAGASGFSGVKGGTTSFGSYVSATGGEGSVFSAAPGGGAPGTGVGGDFNSSGSYGTDGSPTTNTYGGAGGASPLGGGGRGTSGGGVPANAVGYGGGAGGTYSSTASAGGTGASGAIIIEWRSA